MKYAYTFCCALLCIPAAAQIELLSTDMPAIGDVLVNSVDTLPSVSQGPSGAMQFWDLSEAIEHFQQVQSIVDPATTPYAADYPGASLASTTDNESFVYYQNTGTELTVLGGAGDPLGSGTIFNAPFIPTLTAHEFPRTWTSAFSDTYGLEVVADGGDFGVYQVRFKQVGSVSDTTDGYGQVATPVGTYDGLRAFNRTITTDSIWIKLFSFTPWQLVLDGTDTTANFTWYAKETKLLVADLALDSLGNPARFIWSNIEPQSTGLNVPTPSPVAQLYPQPASDEVRLQGTAFTGNFTLTDQTGKVVRQGTWRGGDQRVPLTGLPEGMYQLQVDDMGGRTWKGRVIKGNTH
jgi:hypothetical protein